MTDVQTLIKLAEHRGLRLIAEGDNLRVRGPRGSLNPQLMSDLQLHKHAVLRCLENAGLEPWAASLEAAKMPSSLLVLDFETYFDREHSLKKATIPEYVNDPRFRVHGLALRRPDGSVAFPADTSTALDRLESEFGPELAGVTVVCHNAYFDLYVLQHRFGLRPAHFIDTMLLAYHVHGRRGRQRQGSASLRGLAERYGLQPKGELEFMEGVRQPDAMQWADLQDYACHDAELTFQIAQKLLPEITRPGVELPILQHTVCLFTERSVCADLDLLDELEREGLQAVGSKVEATGVEREELTRDSRFSHLLTQALASTGRSLPTKPGKNGPIPATAKGDPAMIELQKDSDPTVRALVEARLAIKSSDQFATRLATMRRIAHASDGRIPVFLSYFGAHTGRFAGGGKLNLQNFGRSGLGGKLRGVLRADPGCRLILADLSQIEARIVAWYARETAQLQSFAEGRDIYSEFASKFFHAEVRKPRENDPPEVAEQMSVLRQIGKAAILGLGFSMGAKRFLDDLKSRPQLAPLFADGRLDNAACTALVRTYRGEFEAIPELWKSLENAMRTVIDGGHSEVAGLLFEKSGGLVKVWLPSGRALRYPQPRLDYTKRTIEYLDANGCPAEWTPKEPAMVYGDDEHLYGGVLTENVVQATARDLLVEAMLDLEAQGLQTLFHVHDELVIQVPEDGAEAAASRVQARMNQTPGWADGLPVASEVKVVERFEK